MGNDNTDELIACWRRTLASIEANELACFELLLILEQLPTALDELKAMSCSASTEEIKELSIVLGRVLAALQLLSSRVDACSVSSSQRLPQD